jgi:mono/diheme cytochrome c family protein
MVPAMTPAAAGRTVWDYVYTDAQASRGTRLFTDHCALCHAVNMLGGPGGAPALLGPEFKFVWNDWTVGALFVIVRAKMPPGEAGSLSDQEYADIVAAILQVNGFPAGDDTELPGDGALTGDIRITWDRP